MLLFILGCGDGTLESIDVTIQDTRNLKSVSVCHNPTSAQHGHLCEIEADDHMGDYETCHWNLDNATGDLHHVKGSFCWVLTRNDCRPPLTHEWQETNCHFFSEE